VLVAFGLSGNVFGELGLESGFGRALDDADAVVAAGAIGSMGGAAGAGFASGAAEGATSVGRVGVSECAGCSS